MILSLVWMDHRRKEKKEPSWLERSTPREILLEQIDALAEQNLVAASVWIWR